MTANQFFVPVIAENASRLVLRGEEHRHLARAARVRPGDELTIVLENSLDAPTNLHSHGLHVSPSPSHAWAHLESEVRPRFLEVTASLDDIVPITGGTAKCKVRSCTVVREVDVAGHPVTSEADKS